MWERIGIETEQKQVNNIITKAKKDYENYLAKQRQKQNAKKKKTTKKVIYTSGKIDTTNAIVRYAIQFNGNPYVSGGTSLTRGLIAVVLHKVSINILEYQLLEHQDNKLNKVRLLVLMN